MAWHTLNETVKLTGRSRRSIYRDMDKGLVSYGLDASGNRQFETSELMRAYGALTAVAQAVTPELAQVGTHVPWDVLLAELQALRIEVQELRTAVLLIEHKPDITQKAEHSELRTPSGPTTWASLCNALDE
jgi:hypothetical protein